MAIYISKNAISKNPFVTQEIDKEEKKYPPLTTDFLKTPYLIQIMTSPKSGVYLSKYKVNNDKISVRRIKEALNFIHTFTGSVGGNIYQIPGGELLEARQINSGVFDDKLEAAVIEFQKFVGITEDGVIGPETLYHIDNFLHSFFSREDKENEILGKAINKSIMVKPGELIDDGDGNVYYLYGIRIGEKTYSYQHYGNTPMSTSPIDTMLDGKNAFIFKDVTKEEIINQNNIIEDNEQAFIRRSKMMSFSGDLKTAGLNLGIEDVESELDITPPQILSEEQAYLYLVSEGDTLMKIVEREYYNNQSVDIPNPLSDTGEAIYTLKAQTLNENTDTREHDAKLQFYINLLYYYNSVEEKDGTTTEYGVSKSANYKRYENTHLNEYEMFDNTFDPNNPETTLPNYYRFLKYQESKGSKIEFDSAGEVTSFVMNRGKYMYIPTREFADSLYYEMNFRPQEMLVEKESWYDYLEDNAFIQLATDITKEISKLIGHADEILQFLKVETEELLNEAFAFITKLYNYLEEVIKEVPRGLGAELAGGIGVTWGYPIATDFEFKRTFYRKMTPLSEFTLVLREQAIAFVGLDTGIGHNVGGKIGKGKNKIGGGIQSAMGIKAGLKPNVTMEYEFPLRREETAIIVLLFHLFGDLKLKAAARLMGTINILNLDPTQYLTYMKVGIPFDVNIWGNAAIGVQKGKANEDKNLTIPKTQVNAVERKDKGFFGIDNILGILPGAGVEGDLNIAIGPEFEYRAEYDKKPYIPEVTGRVPSEVSFKNSYIVSGSLAIGSMGNFMQKVLFFVTGVENFLGLLDFDTGYGLAIERKWQRQANARTISLNDVNISSGINANDITVEEVNGKARIGNEKGIWETQLSINRFSGDVDALFVSGADTSLKFDAGKIINLLKNNQGVFSLQSFEDLLQLVYSVEIQYKPGIGYSRRKSKRVFAKSILTTMAQPGILKGVKKDFISTINNNSSKPKLGLNVYAGAYVKVEFKIQNLIKFMSYYLKRWYFAVKKTAENTDVATDKLKGVVAALKYRIKRFDEGYPAKKKDTKPYYEELFVALNSEMEVFIDEDGVPQDFKGAAKELFNVTTFLLKYLILGNEEDENTSWWEVLDLKGFAKGFITIAEIIETEIYFEAMGGVSGDFIASGADGAKVRLSFFGEGALVYVPLIMKKNKIVPLEIDDPEKPLFDQLEKLIDIDGEGAKPNGIRQSIITLPS